MTDYTEAALTEAALNTWPYTFRQPRWVGAVQVRSAAGFSARRTLDVVVFDTWPSAGMALHGLEIKLTTQDVRRELDKPEKSGAFMDFIDRFSLVAPPGVVDLKLLPKTWGLYMPTSDGTLRARRKPLPLQPGKSPPDTVNRSFMGAFVRALVDRSIDTNALSAEYDRGHNDSKKSMQYDLDRADRKVEALRATIATFEEKSGLNIETWRVGAMGEAVKFILAGGLEVKLRYSDSLRDVGERMIGLADEMDALKTNLEVSDG